MRMKGCTSPKRFIGVQNFTVHELIVADVCRIGHVGHAADELVVEMPRCTQQDGFFAFRSNSEHNLVAGFPVFDKGGDQFWGS